MNDLIYDGQSLNSKGFAIKTYPIHKVAERDITFVSTASRDGDVIVDNMRYKNVEMSYQVNSIPHLTTLGQSALIRDFIEWLTPKNGEYKIFRDDFNKGYFCKAICTSIGEISNNLSKYIDTTLTFIRTPFWYSDSGENKFTITQADTYYEVNNPEAYASQPTIKIYGLGELTLIINSKEYTVSIPKNYGYIELDTENQSAHVGNISYDKNTFFDYFPTLKPGVNFIKCVPYQNSTSAKLNQIELIPHWRRL